jgi:hypothetical protein
MATDSLKVSAAIEESRPVDRDPLTPVEARVSTRIAPRMKRAMVALLEALEYVQDLQCGLWDFAVEISAFRRLKVSNSDLRWLIAKGLIEHAIEVTLAGDSDRSFRRPVRPVFCNKTCFVLTPSGAKLACDLRGDAQPASNGNGHAPVVAGRLAIASEPEVLAPKWDQDRQELKIGSIVVKRFKVPANNQEAVLAAFEEESWPPRIDDPLPPHRDQSPKRRLQETIKSLNRNQKRPLIRFLGDGSGQGVRWEFCCDPPEGTEL